MPPEGDSAIPGSGVGMAPVPFTVTELLAVALFTVSVEVSDPLIVGVKVNVTVHVTPAPSTKPFEQVPPVFVKSAAFVPVKVKNGVDSVSETPPLFVTVAVTAALVVPIVVVGKATGRGVIKRLAVLCPVMVRLAVAVVVVALNVAVADSAPTMEGTPWRVLVQVCPAVRTAPDTQVSPPVVPTMKSAGFAPLKVVNGVESVKLVVPVLVMMNCLGVEVVPCGTVPKFQLVGVELMDVVETATPVPEMGAEPFTLPEILRVAERAPTAGGVKVKRTVQLPAAATVPPLAHVPPVRTKSAAFVPVSVKNGVFRMSEAEPVFETVTVRAELVEPCV
jgi:hypothetical protein